MPPNKPLDYDAWVEGLATGEVTVVTAKRICSTLKSTAWELANRATVAEKAF